MTVKVHHTKFVVARGYTALCNRSGKRIDVRDALKRLYGDENLSEGEHFRDAAFADFVQAEWAAYKAENGLKGEYITL